VPDLGTYDGRVKVITDWILPIHFAY